MTEFSLDGVFSALHAAPVKSRGGGRALMFISARSGEGVSTIARAAARACDDRTTYCIDLDLRHNGLGRGFAAEGPPLGPKIDGKLSGTVFYRIVGPDDAVVHEITPAFSYHRLGRSRVYVGALDGHAVPQGGRVLIDATPDYWNAARAGGAMVIVDAPALERSIVALRVAPHMDGVVLVVGDGQDEVPSALAAKMELEAAGAKLLGLVYSRASAPVLAMDRLLRKAS